jgi:uncharacterized membrane protein
MTPGLGFALGAMLCFGVGDLIYKRAAVAGIEAGQFVMLQAWAFCPGITLYAWLTGTLDPHLSALWGSLAGLFLLIATYNFVRSLQGGAVSTNAPIFRLNFTITAALAILLLGETLTVAKAVALACALVAVWLLLAEPGATRGQLNMGSLTRVLIATVAMAFANLFYKVGLLHGDADALHARAALSRHARRLALFHPRSAGAFGRLCAADARAGARAGQRARAGGADELRVYRAARRGDVSRKPEYAKTRRPHGRRRSAGVVCSELN